MRTKQKSLIIAVVALMLLLAVSLTGCLKIGMQKKNVIERLEKAGAKVTYEKNTPMTSDGQKNYKIVDILLAVLEIDGEERSVYVVYAGDDKSADWVESRFDEYKGAEGYESWLVYRYERAVMFGYFKAVAIARNY